MSNRSTINDHLLGAPPGAVELAQNWDADLVGKLLTAVWNAYDIIHVFALSKVDWSIGLVNVERAITQRFAAALTKQIALIDDGFFPVVVLHGPSEEESRSTTKENAVPPEYDIAFVWIEDERLMWPLEAKVLKNDRDTGDNLDYYIETIEQKFLTYTYAPFSNGSAMLGYLRSGNPDTVIGHIQTRLGKRLADHPDFPLRCHKTSDHDRSAAIPAGKDYPVHLKLHHLIMPLP